jgi:hypothetical protein
MIGDFLLELAEDAELLARYRDDPARVLAESGLTDEQQEILRSNDLKRIRDAIRAEYQEAKVILVPWPMMNIIGFES